VVRSVGATIQRYLDGPLRGRRGRWRCEQALTIVGHRADRHGRNGARFQVTEIKFGLPMATFLPRLGRPGFANEVCMTGRMFGAEEGRDAGFVTEVVDDGEHLRAAESLARRILENPQAGVREHVRARRTVLAEAADHYLGFSAEFRQGWATDAAARTAVAARASELGGGARAGS
jgi:enoyl-CoA hydratase/carnithine racemase